MGALSELIASRNLDLVDPIMRDAVNNGTPVRILMRTISHIPPLAVAVPFWANPFIALTIGIFIGGVSVAVGVKFWSYSLTRDTIILARRSTPRREYLVRTHTSHDEFNQRWYSVTILWSAADKQLVLDFDATVEAPQAIVNKRAIDAAGNPCNVDQAAEMQYLVRAEGWQMCSISDVWVSQSQWEQDERIGPLVLQYEMGVGQGRWTQAVLRPQQQSVRQERDGFGRFR